MTMIDLHDLTAQRLRNVAYSASIDLDGVTKKNEIVEKLQEENVELTDEGWVHDGEEFELQEQTSKPTDTAIVYGFQRAAATDEILEEIQELLEDSRFEFRLMDETDSGKHPVKIVIPADVEDTE